jgi:DNA-binding NtrC family response regulator
MFIIVASNNIFRRELTSYTLIEAGHTVREMHTLEQLQHVLERETPVLVVVDSTIAEPEVVSGVVDRYTTAPVLWLGRPAIPYSNGSALASLSWPYRPDELLAYIMRLSERGIAAGLPPMSLNQPMFGQND